MIKTLLRIVIAMVGAALGVTLGIYVNTLIPFLRTGNISVKVASIATAGILFGLIFYLISPFFIRFGKAVSSKIEKEVSTTPMVDVLSGSFGLIVGLLIAYFIAGIFIGIPIVGPALATLLYILLGYTGMVIATRRKDDIFNLFQAIRIGGHKEKQPTKKSGGIPPKILDTSVIIDGRIADIVQTGFLEGKLVVPSFVLEELRHIADSADDLKRARGRRGLDILNMMQTELKIETEISNLDFDDISEVDVKLLKLAQVMDGCVLTNDYNLNKVAQFQGVKVLNINELANAIKPLLIPGEEMVTNIVREGKEYNQGIAYLDDGTMIVVEGGKKLIGQTLKVVVTSVLQTAAGRMIFAKPK